MPSLNETTPRKFVGKEEIAHRSDGGEAEAGRGRCYGMTKQEQLQEYYCHKTESIPSRPPALPKLLRSKTKRSVNLAVSRRVVIVL